MINVYILLLVLIVGAFFATKKLTGRSRRSGVSKRMKWTIGVYLTVLLLSVPIALLLSGDNTSIINSNLTEAEIYEYEASLMGELSEGNVEEMAQENRTEDWIFDYSNEVLDLYMNEDENLNISVYVEEVESQTDEIEATYFFPYLSVNDMNLSNELNPIELELREDTLWFFGPRTVNLDYSIFETQFTSSQFNGESWMVRGSDITHGKHILYLKVPDSVELDASFNIEIRQVQ